MPAINLTAKGRDQELILAYLRENASDILADKINNGTPFEKDGNRLVNKKDLNGFMSFACDEAKKLAEKGSRSACVEDSVVYGWAVHYFEEDSIQGKLFNPDGTEYKPPVPVKQPVQTQPKPAIPPKPKEPNLFDMIAASEKQEPQAAEKPERATPKPAEPTIEQIAESLQTAVNEKQNAAPKKDDVTELYEQYERRYPDRVIVMRVGDFYEVFGQKAELTAKELDLTLTSKRVSDTARIPMCGFPHHVKDRYLNKLRKSRSAIVIDGDDVQKLDAYSFEDLLDGEPDDYDDLTEEEMKPFDGDIQEPAVVPKTVMTAEQKDETKYVLSKDDIVFEPSALNKLHEILGDILA